MNISKINIRSTRHFWEWLNIVWNRVDKQRIKEVGPDRACAEWLMRNGAYIKWGDSNGLTTDYNALPPEGERHFITEVDGTDASINAMGFPHFEGCNHIERVRFHKCTYLDDSAMQNMAYLKNTLKYLEISNNGNISDIGVKSLGILSKLNSLVLFDLMEVKNKGACVDYLNKSLPNCAVNFK